MKRLLMSLVASSCMFVGVAAQSPELTFADSLLAPGSFVLRGNMAPGQGNVLSFAVTELIGYNDGYDAIADSTGRFEMSVPMTGPIQQIYLYVDNVVTVPVVPGDTVNVNIGDDGVNVTGATPEATLDMELAQRLHREMRPRFLDLNRAYYDVFYKLRTDSAKIAYVKDADRYFSDYRDIVDDFESEHGEVRSHDYFYNSGYFGLLHLFAHTEVADSIAFRYDGEDDCHHKLVKSEYLKYPNAGRALDAYLTGATRRAVYGNSHLSRPGADEIIKQSRYTRSIATDDVIADYADCSTVFDLLHSGRFWDGDGGESMKNYFLEVNTSPAFKNIITGTIAEMERTRSGCMSPRLSLKGLDGKHYTLDDFKGKFVLLDFWSPGCGPCRTEFKNMKEFKELFAEYADRVAYVTVCVMSDHPSDRATMLNVIERFEMDDLNTTLDSDGSDELYHINVFPTYVMIDPEGRIVNFNIDRPTMIMNIKKRGAITEFESALRGELILPKR